MLYKLQLDNVQREIIQAQEVLTVIETQRDDAETAAADALSRLRYEEGIRRGRNVGYTEGRVVGLENGRSQMRETAAASVDRMLDTQPIINEPRKLFHGYSSREPPLLCMGTSSSPFFR